MKFVSIPIFIGVVSGSLSSAFLHLLNTVTVLREGHPVFLYFLPLFGLLYYLVIKNIPYHIHQGIPHLIEELKNDRPQISPWMTPFIFFSALGTHLFGGSAGREGVGVIMGASAAHLLPKFHRSFSDARRFLIYGGMAGGFSSIFGTPLAAIIFTFELHSFKDLRDLKLMMTTTLSAFISFWISNFLAPEHQHFSVMFSWAEVIPYVLLSGVFSGLGAHLYFWGFKGYAKLISYLLSNLGLKIFIGSILICLLVTASGAYQYLGIGTDVIASSFGREMSYYDFSMKAILTIMTLSIGFKGGEVTPLFFMGSTFSNWICSFFNFKNFGVSSSLGMVALFGALTATPIASSIMGAELFGPQVGILCLLSCLIARFLFGKKSLYRH